MKLYFFCLLACTTISSKKILNHKPSQDSFQQQTINQLNNKHCTKDKQCEFPQKCLQNLCKKKQCNKVCDTGMKCLNEKCVSLDTCETVYDCSQIIDQCVERKCVATRIGGPFLFLGPASIIENNVGQGQQDKK